jgi:hypothetical protein
MNSETARHKGSQFSIIKIRFNTRSSRQVRKIYKNKIQLPFSCRRITPKLNDVLKVSNPDKQKITSENSRKYSNLS